MRGSKAIALVTVLVFSITLSAGSYSFSNDQSKTDKEIARLLEAADQHYRNGNFKEAIQVYESVIEKLRQKKELAQTKGKLFEIMISLAFTHFTIQENDLAEAQLEKVIRGNPNQELDEEFYPPQFVGIFKTLQKRMLGGLFITTVPSGAIIYLDGKRIGKTPLDVDRFLAGEYQLKATLKNYRDLEQPITVSPGVKNRENLVMKKPEKELPPDKDQAGQVITGPGKRGKKRKISPVIIVAGVAVAVAAILLLASGKNGTDPPVLKSLSFSNTEPSAITAAGGVSTLTVAGIPSGAQIQNIHIQVSIKHEAMEDLSISLIGTDTKTSLLLWQRKESPDETTVIDEITNAFNAVPANGDWKLLVSNTGNKPGEIVSWSLQINYYEQQ